MPSPPVSRIIEQYAWPGGLTTFHRGKKGELKKLDGADS
jgi:hypothetical protein